MTFTRSLPSFSGSSVDVRLAEDHEQVALAGVLQVVGHVQVGVHARLEHRDAAELAELGGVRLVVEGAGDQHVEPGVARLAGGRDEVGPLDGAELGADEDGGALLGVALEVAALGADQLAGPGRERGEGDPVLLVRLLDAGGLQVLQDHLREGLSGSVLGRCPPSAVSISSSFSSTPSTRCGLRLSTVKGPATRTFFLSS